MLMHEICQCFSSLFVNEVFTVVSCGADHLAKQHYRGVLATLVGYLRDHGCFNTLAALLYRCVELGVDITDPYCRTLQFSPCSTACDACLPPAADTWSPVLQSRQVELPTVLRLPDPEVNLAPHHSSLVHYHVPAALYTAMTATRQGITSAPGSSGSTGGVPDELPGLAWPVLTSSSGNACAIPAAPVRRSFPSAPQSDMRLAPVFLSNMPSQVHAAGPERSMPTVSAGNTAEAGGSPAHHDGVTVDVLKMLDLDRHRQTLITRHAPYMD